MRAILIFAALVLTACASTPAPETITYVRWQAIGYLLPSQTNGQDLGLFETLGECNAAVEGWRSKQVVGNPVSGDCIAVNVTE